MVQHKVITTCLVVLQTVQVNTYTVFVPYNTPLTIGHFYNNPENPGYSFEILEEISTSSGGYDLTGVTGYTTCLQSCTI